jgi:ribosomal protein S27E
MPGRQGCAVAGLPHRYARHKPEQTPLYSIVETHAHRFFAELREQGTSLPGFAQAEFDHYLRCGRFEESFLRVKCTDCRHEHLVAFSCKRRGFCPSCSARRMLQTAAQLVDHVFPQVPVRQWVLSFPWPLRVLFAARPDLLTCVLGVATRALSTAVIKRAGLSRGAGAETGLMTFIQRFGSALNLNIHRTCWCSTALTPSAMARRDSTVRRHRRRARLNACSIPSRGELLAPWCAPVCWSKIPSNPGSTWKRAAPRTIRTQAVVTHP